MTIIRELTDHEYATWIEAAVPAYAHDKVASGAWPEDTALELSRKSYETLLPHGKGTSGNYFYAIVDPGDLRVGTLWFAAKDEGAGRVAFVYDIEVCASHRRRGVAQRAFEALEVEVRTLGLAGIALHVFGHNAPALGLYAKLGYVTTDINMFKAVGTR